MIYWKDERAMDEQKVPYIVFEGEQARHERTAKRLVIALIISIVLLFTTNLAWLYFFNSFDIVTETVTQDTDTGGYNAFVGKNGAITNGASESQDKNDDH